MLSLISTHYCHSLYKRRLIIYHFIGHFLSVFGQWALLVFKQTDLGVGVVGTTSHRSVLEPTAPSVLDAIGHPYVLEA